MAHPQANCGDKPVGEYLFPTLGKVGSPILIPDIQADQWEIKTSLIHMVSRNPFIGEHNPYTHLAFFLELCGTFKLLNVPNEVIYLKLFPFSLMGRAKDWLYSHEPDTFTSWEELANAFLLEFFPPAITKKFKQQIRAFEQDEDETFYETYQRFKELLRECPHHNINKWDLLHSFYDGLTPNGRSKLDLSSGGAFMDLNVEEGFKKIEKLARNSHLWEGRKVSESSVVPKKVVKTCAMVESSLDGHNQAFEYNFLYEDDEDTILQVEEVIIGKEFEVKVDTPLPSNPRYEPSSLFENALFEFEDFSLCDNELFNDDLLHDEETQISTSLELEAFTLFANELFELKDFTLMNNDLFENNSLCFDDATPLPISLESLDDDCDYETPMPSFTLPIIVEFRSNDSLLMHDRTLDSFHVHEESKKVVSFVVYELDGRSSQLFLLVEFRPRLNGRKFKWDLKVD